MWAMIQSNELKWKDPRRSWVLCLYYPPLTWQHPRRLITVEPNQEHWVPDWVRGDVGYVPSLTLTLMRNEGHNWDRMRWMKNEAVKSNGERRFGEEWGKVCGFGKAWKNGLAIVCCNTGGTKKVLGMMNEEWKGCEMVVDWVKLGVTRHYLPNWEMWEVVVARMKC